MKRVAGVVVVLCLLSACSDQDVLGGGGAGGNTAVAGAGGDASLAGGGAGGDSGAGSGLPIWDEHSALLHVKSGDFFSGYFGYKRSRSELSQAQRTELAQIRTGPDLYHCVEDDLSVVFEVTDDSDHVAEFRNDTCSSGYVFVDPQASEHFVAQLPCVPSKDPRLAALSTAPEVEIGDGCENGLFTASGDQGTPQWLRVNVSTPNVPVLLELADCGDRSFELELLNEAGDTVLETSDEGCPSLTHSFATAGSYVVRVTLTGGSGAGDLTFRAERSAPTN